MITAQGHLRNIELCPKQVHISQFFSFLNPFPKLRSKNINPYPDMKQNINIIEASGIYFRRVSPFRTAVMKVLALKGRERAIVSQTNIGTVSKATLGKLLRDKVERIWAFPSA